MVHQYQVCEESEERKKERLDQCKKINHKRVKRVHNIILVVHSYHFF